MSAPLGNLVKSSNSLPGHEGRPGLLRRWDDFWFRAVDPTGLAVLRVLSGVLFLTWMILGFAGHQQEFLGRDGFFDRKGEEEAQKADERNAENFRKQGVPFTPPPTMPVERGWSVFDWSGDDPQTLLTLYWAG